MWIPTQEVVVHQVQRRPATRHRSDPVFPGEEEERQPGEGMRNCSESSFMVSQAHGHGSSVSQMGHLGLPEIGHLLSSPDTRGGRERNPGDLDRQAFGSP